MSLYLTASELIYTPHFMPITRLLNEIKLTTVLPLLAATQYYYSTKLSRRKIFAIFINWTALDFFFLANCKFWSVNFLWLPIHEKCWTSKVLALYCNYRDGGILEWWPALCSIYIHVCKCTDILIVGFFPDLSWRVKWY